MTHHFWQFRRCRFGMVAVVLVALAAEKKDTSDWPQFRGSALQNGVAKSELPATLEEIWQFSTKDSIEAGAAIIGDTVYVASMDEHLYALELANGKEKWRYKANAFKAAPSVHGDRVYIGDTEGIFHCVDRQNGKKLWTYTTGGEIVASANFAGDSVLFGSYADETLYCLTLDGRVNWKFKTGGPVNGSPAVVDGRTFVAGCDAILHVIDVNTGKEISQLDLEGPAGASAAVDGNSLYVGTMNNQFFGIDWAKNSVSWRFEAPKRSQPFYSSAALTPQIAVVGSRDKNVYGIHRQTGHDVWVFPTRGKVDSSPVIVNKRVYVGSGDGNLYVLSLGSGEEVQRLALGKGITASPAVARERLVIGTVDGVVYCLGKK